MNDSDIYKLDVPYLLALDAGVNRLSDGSYWTNALWARDLQGHIDHLPQLTMFGTVLPPPAEPDAVKLRVDNTRFVASRRKYGRLSFLLGLPRFLTVLTREIRRTTVVHTTVAGDFMPYGWFAIPIARLFGKKIIVVIESSFWRLHEGEKATLGRRARAWMIERINRWCMRQVDYATYQHEEYRKTLPAPRANGGVLMQASWISAGDVISEATLDARAVHRRSSHRLPKFLFATRFVPAKGTRELVDAIRTLANMNIDCDIDVIGDGEDHALFSALNGMTIGKGRMRLLDPLPYGAGFLSFLSDYDILLSPSRSNEQPRIIYDAGSQGIGAIITDTLGLRSCVLEGESALVIPVGDAQSLAEAVALLAQSPDLIDHLASGARRNALANTHERMHEERYRGIKAMLDGEGSNRVSANH